MSETEKYLRFVAEHAEKYRKKTVEHFVLKHGQEFKRRAPVELMKTLPKGKKRHCFDNAAHLALSCSDFIYCEGYALWHIPVNHAWCVTAAGEIVDTTWGNSGMDYFGVPFQTSYLQAHLLRTHIYGLLYDAGGKGEPMMLVRGKVSPADFREPLQDEIELYQAGLLTLAEFMKPNLGQPWPGQEKGLL